MKWQHSWVLLLNTGQIYWETLFIYLYLVVLNCLQMFGTSLSDMSEHLDQGDVAETVRVYFEKSTKLPPQNKSTISLQEVDAYLEQMSKVTREDDQQKVLTMVAKR